MATPARLAAAARELQNTGLIWLLWDDGRDAVLDVDLYVRLHAKVFEGCRAFLDAPSFLRAVAALEKRRELTS